MSRYSRQIQVKQLGLSGQSLLEKARVALVGVGGLGSPIAQYLVGAGVGNLILIDHDDISETNLHRQILYRESDIGQSKATVAQKRLSQLNSEVSITAYANKISADTIDELLSQSDVVVDACDNFAISYLLSDYARMHKKPLVSGSVMLTSGYVGVYCFSTATQSLCPSLRALFPNPPEAGQDCNSVGVLGTAAGIIGVIQAQEVIKVIVGDENQLAGKLLSIDCWTYRQNIIDCSSALEPENTVKIITTSDITENDWLIDVRSAREVDNQPMHANQHTPIDDLDISALPKNQRLVFMCSVGQRALSAADNALEHGYADVAVCL